MIAANVCAADFLLDYEIPALFRVHKGPSEDKLANLRQFLAELGLSLGGGDEPLPKHYAKLLQGLGDRPDAHLIQTVMLRSLSQAVYTPENNGHFGLAFDGYAHFTSPIRRYPDLLVHRAIRHCLHYNSKKGFAYGPGEMAVMGEHCSMTERRADDATRDATDWLKCEFMLERVGEEFDGIITSVTGFGLFVELSDIYVEGLVHITSLASDYYEFDAQKHRLVGERSRVVYRLADKVRIKVARVDLDRKRIDFDIAGVEGGKPADTVEGTDQAKPKKRSTKKEGDVKPDAPKKKRPRKKRSKKKVVVE